jgi:hypothetical protein
MKKFTATTDRNPIETPAYSHIMMLDNNVTRLRMARQDEAPAVAAPVSVAQPEESSNTSATSKEAAAVFVLVAMFTALFWVAITYLRS